MPSLGDTSPSCRSVTRRPGNNCRQRLQLSPVACVGLGLKDKAFYQAAIDQWLRELGMRKDAYFDILLSVAACSSWLSQVLHLGLWHSLPIKRPQAENSAFSYDSHTWALSEASYLQTGSAPGWPCFPGVLVTSLFESLRRQFPQDLWRSLLQRWLNSF